MEPKAFLVAALKLFLSQSGVLRGFVEDPQDQPGLAMSFLTSANMPNQTAHNSFCDLTWLAAANRSECQEQFRLAVSTKKAHLFDFSQSHPFELSQRANATVSELLASKVNVSVVKIYTSTLCDTVEKLFLSADPKAVAFSENKLLKVFLICHDSFRETLISILFKKFRYLKNVYDPENNCAPLSSCAPLELMCRGLDECDSASQKQPKSDFNLDTFCMLFLICFGFFIILLEIWKKLRAPPPGRAQYAPHYWNLIFGCWFMLSVANITALAFWLGCASFIEAALIRDSFLYGAICAICCHLNANSKLVASNLDWLSDSNRNSFFNITRLNLLSYMFGLAIIIGNFNSADFPSAERMRDERDRIFRFGQVHLAYFVLHHLVLVVRRTISKQQVGNHPSRVENLEDSPTDCVDLICFAIWLCTIHSSLLFDLMEFNCSSSGFYGNSPMYCWPHICALTVRLALYYYKDGAGY